MLVSIFGELLEAIAEGDEYNVTKFRKEVNQFDRFALRRSKKGQEACKRVIAYDKPNMAKILVEMGMPYTWLKDKGKTSKTKREFKKAYEFYDSSYQGLIKRLTGANEKEFKNIANSLVALVDLRSDYIKLFQKAGASNQVLEYLEALGGISVERASELGIPFSSKELAKAKEPPSLKTFPDISNFNNPDEIFPTAFLGSGTYGSVFVVYIKGYGRTVMKIPSTANKATDSLLRECFFTSALKCENPNVVCTRKCIYPNARNSTMAMFMDYYEGYVDMTVWRECIKKDVMKPGFVGILASIFRQIVLAVGYIHSKNLAHRDLKPANILIKWDMPIIIDFGLAYGGESPKHLAGSLIYISLEVFEKEKDPKVSQEEFFQETMRSDIYALGVILYMFINQVAPYNIPNDVWKMKGPEKIKRIKEIRSLPRIPLKLPIFEKLVDGLLAPSGSRLTINQTIEELDKILGV